MGERVARLDKIVMAATAGDPARRLDAYIFVGAAVMTFGFGAILLGWYGAAHSSYLFQEVPYLISGGILGLALVVTGALVIVAGALARAGSDGRRHARRLEALLAERRSEPGSNVRGVA